MHEKPSPSAPLPDHASIDLPRLMIKTVCLFILFNLVFASVNPLPAMGNLSAYNVLFPGRLRLPFGEDPTKSYNLSLFSLQAMFSSHAVAAPKAANEYRVVLIGDSSTWGYYLNPDQTSSAYLNQANLSWSDGRKMRFYNLGYPTLSLAKDLLILDRALRYQPDLIIWVISLESFPRNTQLDSPIVQHNPAEIQDEIQSYNLKLDPHDPRLVWPNYWQNTLLGRRRDLADLLRLQLYGVMWAATGIDQYYPPSYTPVQVDLSADDTFHKLEPPTLKPTDLSLDILQAGFKAAGNIPVLLVNEPIFLSYGENSNIRYNFFYPRWAYDQYRELLTAQSRANGWHYLDLWNLLPVKEFTNSAIHVTPQGEAEIAQKIGEAIQRIAQ